MSSQGPWLAGVIGWPIGHSLSPIIHSHWLKEAGIHGTYVPLAVRPLEFSQYVAGLIYAGFAGVSVTAPHKEAAFALAKAYDDDAAATGAVNTLVFAGKTIRGLNTDVHGFAASLEEGLGQNAAKAGPAIVLGAGGAARAVVLTLARFGAPEIRLVNRTRKRAEALAEKLKSAPLKVMDWNKLERAFSGVKLLVNATGLGTAGGPKLDISLDNLATAAAVADIVYNPLETNLLASARLRGHKTMNGLGMLMHQAAPAFAAWFGVTPKVTPALRAILEKALRRD